MFPKCGTGGFVAPEILALRDRFQTYSDVCDVFSAGVVFFRLLTEKRLIKSKRLDEIYQINEICNMKNH